MKPNLSLGTSLLAIGRVEGGDGRWSFAGNATTGSNESVGFKLQWVAERESVKGRRSERAGAMWKLEFWSCCVMSNKVCRKRFGCNFKKLGECKCNTNRF